MQAVIIGKESGFTSSLASKIKSSVDGVTFYLIGGTEQARVFLSAHVADVIVMDYETAISGDFSFLRYLSVEYSKAKIIIHTNTESFALAKEAVSCGVFAYITQDKNGEQLLKAFRSIGRILTSEEKSREEKAEKAMRDGEIKSFLREQFFFNLSVGNFGDKEAMEENLKLLELPSEAENCPCVVFSITIKDFEDIVNEVKYDAERIKLAVKNILCAINPEAGYYRIGLISDKIKFIGVPLSREFAQCFKSGTKKILADFPVLCEEMIGISVLTENVNFYKSIVDFSKEITPFTLKYQETGGDAVSNLSSGSQKLLLEKYKHLVAGVFLGSHDDVRALLNRFMDEIKDLPLSYVHQLIYGFINILVKSLKQSQIYSGGEIFAIPYYKILPEIKEIGEIRGWCENMISIISTSSHIKSGSPTKENLLERIKYYINMNFTKDISLGDVAAYVYLNPVYLSRFFKENVGENFLAYVVRLRMQYAAYMLRLGNKKIYEISKMSGYGNSKYFSKTFKKYMGCGPKDYLLQNSELNY